MKLIRKRAILFPCYNKSTILLGSIVGLLISANSHMLDLA